VAIRLSAAAAGTIHWQDDWHGPQQQALAATVGDCVVRRKDGFHAYQLAVVVDDARQAITQVVRGRDLMDHTAQQRFLQAALQLPPVRYAHVPLVTAPDGSKLAKSQSSAAIAPLPPAEALWLALQLLRQQPPNALRQCTLTQIWDWANNHWNPDPLRGVETLPAPAVYHPLPH
jgi:glutamyl-Q tRNA(Asp) synthetase